MESVGQDAHVDTGQAQFLAVLAMYERGVEEVLSDESEPWSGSAEIALAIAVETSESADVASDVHCDVVEKSESDKASEDDEERVAIVNVSCLYCFQHHRGVVGSWHDVYSERVGFGPLSSIQSSGFV